MYSLSDVIYKFLRLSIRLLNRSRRYTRRYKLEMNCDKRSDSLVLILAGYQPYLWNSEQESLLNDNNEAPITTLMGGVFDRFKKYIPDDYDVCIVSSGKYLTSISKICKDNNWNYISTKANKLAMALNVATKCFSNAQMIFKFDEDIFIGENYFRNMVATYNKANQDGLYKIGFVAPVINVNGSSEPLVLYEIMPDIKGIVIVASGAGDVRVKLDILKAVQALLNVQSSQVEIFVKGNN